MSPGVLSKFAVSSSASADHLEGWLAMISVGSTEPTNSESDIEVGVDSFEDTRDSYHELGEEKQSNAIRVYQRLTDNLPVSSLGEVKAAYLCS